MPTSNAKSVAEKLLVIINKKQLFMYIYVYLFDSISILMTSKGLCPVHVTRDPKVATFLKLR